LTDSNRRKSYKRLTFIAPSNPILIKLENLSEVANLKSGLNAE
jgi:hypothetical protein